MADINDRLERLSRRDELARRARERSVPPAVAGVGGDFMEAIEAVAAVVRRHPGMSVMLAPGDGRRRSSVIRVTERRGEAEVAPVTMASMGEPEFGPPGHLEPEYGPDPGGLVDPSRPDLRRSEPVQPDFGRPDHSYPNLSRPPVGPPGPSGLLAPAGAPPGVLPLDTVPIDTVPLDSAYGMPGRGPEPPPWRPPPEPARQQPYENTPAEGWSWER